MKKSIKIKDNIYWVGVNDFETKLFEALWPLPYGVSYNSYLILGENNILIDTVKYSKIDNLLENIQSNLGNKKLDYLIINHMEPDHSGSIKILTKIFPDLKIIGNKKTISLLNDFYSINKNVIEVNDKETININGYSFQFFLTPMVHWPETMLTYELNNKILFSGDVFGGFGTLNGGIFDDEVDLQFYENEIRRYFSNIIGKYCNMVQKALEKIKNIEIKMIASTHGPIFRTNPCYIIDKYDKWSKHESECGVVVAYASMYGNTQIMAETVARSLSENGIKKIRLYNVSNTHSSFIINDIWQFKGLILGSCTYNTKIFPHMNSLLCLLDNDKLLNKYLGIFGSYSWSGGALKRLKDFSENGEFEIISPDIESKSHPTDTDLEKCYELGKNMAQKLINCNL